jgi:hypothetical protein
MKKQVFASGFLLVSLGWIAAMAAQVEVVGSIQATIDSSEPGSVIHVPAGVYREAIVLKDGMTLLGDGADLTVLDGGGTRKVITGARDTAVIGVTVQNGQIGIDNNHNFMGVFECRVVSNVLHGILMQKGTGLIENNLVGYTRQIAGIACFGSNPFILGNAIVYNPTGLLVWQEHVPTVTSNCFVGNDIGIRVGGGASLLLDGNRFFENKKKDIEGDELSATDVTGQPVDLKNLFSFKRRSVEEYRATMEKVFKIVTAEHPLVIYYLPEAERGRFNLAMLFPWANFTVAASAKETVIESYGAYDLKTRGKLFSEYSVTSGRPAVSVKSAGITDKDMDRYVLETVYQHPGSYYEDEAGNLVFKRLTNLTRIHIVVPPGYIPASCNYPTTVESVEGKFLVKIANVGETAIELVMKKMNPAP